jgi:MFS family permease
VATCLCGAAKSFPQLFATRMAVGIGEAGFAPAAYSIISDSYPPRRLGYAMSFLRSGVYVGSAASLMLGGFLMDYYTSLGPSAWPVIGVLQPWQATFITVGLPGLALSLMIRFLAEPSRKGVAKISGGSTRVPLALVLKFLWRRKRTYLSLFVGSSMLAMAAYGSSAWYPEFFIRTYGVSRTEAGSSFGALLLTSGLLGIMVGPWVADRLARRHTDYYVRAMLYATLVAMIPAIVAPLVGNKTLTLFLLFLALAFGSVYLGIMAASFQLITPNQMRGLTTAVYIFLTNIFGLAVGASVMAAFTDFIYRDDSMLHYSIASANALFYPLAIALFAYCLKGYRASMAEAGHWKID